MGGRQAITFLLLAASFLVSSYLQASYPKNRFGNKNITLNNIYNILPEKPPEDLLKKALKQNNPWRLEPLNGNGLTIQNGKETVYFVEKRPPMKSQIRVLATIYKLSLSECEKGLIELGRNMLLKYNGEETLRLREERLNSQLLRKILSNGLEKEEKRFKFFPNEKKLLPELAKIKEKLSKINKKKLRFITLEIKLEKLYEKEKNKSDDTDYLELFKNVLNSGFKEVESQLESHEKKIKNKKRKIEEIFSDPDRKVKQFSELVDGFVNCLKQKNYEKEVIPFVDGKKEVVPLDIFAFAVMTVMKEQKKKFDNDEKELLDKKSKQEEEFSEFIDKKNQCEKLKKRFARLTKSEQFFDKEKKRLEFNKKMLCNFYYEICFDHGKKPNHRLFELKMELFPDTYINVGKVFGDLRFKSSYKKHKFEHLRRPESYLVRTTDETFITGETPISDKYCAFYEKKLPDDFKPLSDFLNDKEILKRLVPIDAFREILILCDGLGTGGAQNMCAKNLFVNEKEKDPKKRFIVVMCVGQPDTTRLDQFFNDDWNAENPKESLYLWSVVKGLCNLYKDFTNKKYRKEIKQFVKEISYLQKASNYKDLKALFS